MPCEKCKCAECAKSRKAAAAWDIERIKSDIEGMERCGRIRFSGLDVRIGIIFDRISALSYRCDELEKAARRNRRWWQR